MNQSYFSTFRKNSLILGSIMVCFIIPDSLTAQNVGVQLKDVIKKSTHHTQSRVNVYSSDYIFSGKTKPTNSAFLALKKPIIQAFSAEKLPFFCRFEHKMNKNKPTQVFFRLGNLDLVNEMEGK